MDGNAEQEPADEATQGEDEPLAAEELDEKDLEDAAGGYTKPYYAP